MVQPSKLWYDPQNFEGCTITFALYHNFFPCTIYIFSVKTVSISSVYIDFFLKGPCLFQEESEVIEKQMDK